MDYEIWTGERSTDHEPGTHCNGFVHYAFRLAGLNVRNTGTMGETGDIGGVGALHTVMTERGQRIMPRGYSPASMAFAKGWIMSG